MLIEDPNVFQRDKCFPKIIFRRDGRDGRDRRDRRDGGDRRDRRDNFRRYKFQKIKGEGYNEKVKGW